MVGKQWNSDNAVTNHHFIVPALGRSSTPKDRQKNVIWSLQNPADIDSKVEIFQIMASGETIIPRELGMMEFKELSFVWYDNFTINNLLAEHINDFFHFLFQQKKAVERVADNVQASVIQGFYLNGYSSVRAFFFAFSETGH